MVQILIIFYQMIHHTSIHTETVSASFLYFFGRVSQLPNGQKAQVGHKPAEVSLPRMPQGTECLWDCLECLALLMGRGQASF